MVFFILDVVMIELLMAVIAIARLVVDVVFSVAVAVRKVVNNLTVANLSSPRWLISRLFGRVGNESIMKLLFFW